jgi:uncharacterized protein YjcR
MREQRYNDEEWLREQYIQQRRPIADIAEICGCCSHTVDKWLDIYQIGSNDISSSTQIDDKNYDECRLRDKYKKETWLVKRYEKRGESAKEIAEMCGCSYSTIGKWLAIHDIDTSFYSSDSTGFRYGPGWNENKRNQVRELDNHECANCGMTQEDHQSEHNCKLHVHHLIKARDIDDAEKRNAVKNLVTLCASCHRKWEQMSKMRIKPQIDRDRLPTTG